MFGKKAFKLISELDLSMDLLPFNEILVKEVLDEMNSLYKENLYDSNAIRNDDNMTLLPSVQLRHIALTRNKRCLLAYVYNRMRKIRDLRWELGSILPPEINSNLLNAEVQWFQAYNKSLATYMRSLGEDYGFNITANMLPPKTPYVEVKCVTDFGKLELEDGQVILLKKNTYHLLPRAVCEPLIRQESGLNICQPVCSTFHQEFPIYIHKLKSRVTCSNRTV
uniref:DNA replication complex GINS protein PSF1-like isoform X1 n=1 Tax=Osmia lignaria TaxID=473952 RepID=UPI001478D179|nr:DNA replication complex GINS protein PSF1-like isoform X1 [Osmia lignaria]XP_034173710.1 DNA replication complex GINS protein PSF1-like isoform X1 [Osmia lignaria]